MDEDVMDPTSVLPECIVHIILDLLPTKDAARTSVLSKKWNNVWTSYLLWDFREEFFGVRLVPKIGKAAIRKILKNRKKFINFVYNTLQRYRQHNLSIQKFRLHVGDPRYFVKSNVDHMHFKLASHIDKWIGLVIENHVKELDLVIGFSRVLMFYSVPQLVFTAKSLTVLRLRYCKLDQHLSMDAIKIHSLRELSLRSVLVNEPMIENFINSCPLIEVIILNSCIGLNKIYIRGLLKLTRVKVSTTLDHPHDIQSLEALNLQKLYLSEVHIDEQMIRNIINNCPLIEDFHLRMCYGFKKFNVSGLCKLSNVNLYNSREVESIEIQVPSLQRFSLSCWESVTPYKINMAACHNLNCLLLQNADITDQMFQDLIFDFPLLETLDVYGCEKLESIKISSRQLKKLDLQFCKNLVDAEINTPNLLTFQYCGETIPPVSSINAPCQWEVKILCGDDDDFHIDTHWHLQLIAFVGKLNQVKDLVLVISTGTFVTDGFDLEELRGMLLPPPYEFEHLTLFLDSPSLNNAAFLDGLLLSCYPRKLSVSSSEAKKITKLLYEKQTDKEDPNCCSDCYVKCWRHYLKDVKIENFSKRNENSCHRNTVSVGQPIHSFMDALPNLELDKIQFSLNWQSDS